MPLLGVSMKTVYWRGSTEVAPSATVTAVLVIAALPRRTHRIDLINNYYFSFNVQLKFEILISHTPKFADSATQTSWTLAVYIRGGGGAAAS